MHLPAVRLPSVYRVEQAFPRPVVADLAAAVRSALDALRLGSTLARGARIGVTVGSRGIHDVVPILRAAVAHLGALGFEPVLLAAMGSHGGGTEQGQRELLESLGVTAAATGAAVVTCDACEVIGTTPSGLPVHALRSARGVDALLPVNRVKPHTSFTGRVESGLLKMLAVGLGGPRGAQQFHGFGAAELPRLLVELGEVVLRALPVVGGLAVVENAYEETALVEPVPRSRFVEAEAELLERARALSPRLPTDRIDLLVVEQMGKDFSGTGIDTRVVGRTRIQGVPEPRAPEVRRIAVLELTEASHGNATGVGLADFVTRRLVDRIDRARTYLNCLTSTFVTRAAIPMYFDTDRELFEAALYSLSGVEPRALRIVLIANTLHLASSYVSEAVAGELEGRAGTTVDPRPRELAFDPAGRLTLRVG